MFIHPIKKIFHWAVLMILTLPVQIASAHDIDTIHDHDVHHAHEDAGGIFGGAFHIVGEVLAFPFRLIGDIFDFIF